MAPSGLVQEIADELNAKGLECNRRGDTRGALTLFLEKHTAPVTTSSRSGHAPATPSACEDPALILTLTPTLTDALALFLEAHQLRPSDARFVLSAANMHLKLGELPEATELYTKLDGLIMTPRQQEMARTKRRMCADLQVARSCTLSLGRVRGCKPTQLPPPTHHPRISRASAGGQVGRARPRRAL